MQFHDNKFWVSRAKFTVGKQFRDVITFFLIKYVQYFNTTCVHEYNEPADKI